MIANLPERTAPKHFYEIEIIHCDGFARAGRGELLFDLHGKVGIALLFYGPRGCRRCGRLGSSSSWCRSWER